MKRQIFNTSLLPLLIVILSVLTIMDSNAVTKTNVNAATLPNITFDVHYSELESCKDEVLAQYEGEVSTAVLNVLLKECETENNAQ